MHYEKIRPTLDINKIYLANKNFKKIIYFCIIIINCKTIIKKKESFLMFVLILDKLFVSQKNHHNA